MPVEAVNTGAEKSDATESTAKKPFQQFSEEPSFEPVMLRRATANDAAALGAIGAATFLEAFTWAMPGADVVDFVTRHHTAEAYAKYLAKPDTRITLAVTGEDYPVGYAMICAPDFPSFDVQPSDIELKRIYLFSRFRKGGGTSPAPAQKLMDAAVADARALGRTRLLLGTHAGNERAIRFYRRNAFEVVGARTFVVGEQVCEDYIFGRSL